MEKKLQISTDFKEVRIRGEIAVLFTKEKKRIRIFNTTSFQTRIEYTKCAIKDVRITQNYIIVLFENSIEKICLESWNRISRIVIPEVEQYFELERNSSIVYKNSELFLHTLNGVLMHRKYDYLQIIEDWAIIIFPDGVEVYKEKKRLVYKADIEAFEKRFLEIYEKEERKPTENINSEITIEDKNIRNKDSPISIQIRNNNQKKNNSKSSEDFKQKNKDYKKNRQLEEKECDLKVNNLDLDDIKLKKIFFSIYNRKLYLLVGQRIVGHDLNIYLKDLKHTLSGVSKIDISGLKISQFQCISKALILFDSTQRTIFVVSKNLEKLLFYKKCDEFYYDNESEKLFIFHDRYLCIYTNLNMYNRPFTLIEENIIFQEAEDEFDESDNSYCDLYENVINSIVLQKKRRK